MNQTVIILTGVKATSVRVLPKVVDCEKLHKELNPPHPARLLIFTGDIPFVVKDKDIIKDALDVAAVADAKDFCDQAKSSAVSSKYDLISTPVDEIVEAAVPETKPK